MSYAIVRARDGQIRFFGAPTREVAEVKRQTILSPDRGVFEDPSEFIIYETTEDTAWTLGEDGFYYLAPRDDERMHW